MSNNFSQGKVDLAFRGDDGSGHRSHSHHIESDVSIILAAGAAVCGEAGTAGWDSWAGLPASCRPHLTCPATSGLPLCGDAPIA